MSGEKSFDLEKLKWIRPRAAERFRRSPLVQQFDGGNDALLENISRLTDEVFGDLAVLEQFPEAGSRGAVSDPGIKVVADDIHALLLEVQDRLWSCHNSLLTRREQHVRQQLEALGLAGEQRNLKLHIGAGGHRLPGWLNVDAGGSDLAININWGLPLADNSVSFAYCAHVLEHLRFVDQAPLLLAEIRRVLMDEGVVRLVVPDMAKLFGAYVNRDRAFFAQRQEFYPLDDGFMDEGVANLNYLLLFGGAAAQTLNFNHKFGYDRRTLQDLLEDAGFRVVRDSTYQGSDHAELRVDEAGENASARNVDGSSFSLFVEATK